ncbi:MAG: peptidoglycan DD-metalloendopeptidase family protein [Pseudomonadota bacterium]
MLRRAPIHALLLLALTAPALAQGPSRTGSRPAPLAPEQQRAADAQAGRDAQEEARLAGERVATAQRVLEADARHDAALERQRGATQAADAAGREARARAAAFTAMLPVLRRLALYPAETLLALPAPPEEALRGTLVLRSLARHLREEAGALRAARDAALEAAAMAEAETRHLAEARDLARGAAATLDEQLAALRARHAAMREALRESAREAAAREAATRDAERAQATAARAADLPEMIARLPPPPPRAEPVVLPPPPLVAGLGGLPVAGRITREFGAPGEAGPARGLTIAAPPGSRVVAPCAGRVAFAGAFRSYGQLLILDCGEGLHAVLSGFARLDASTGERAAAGEPVGILGEAGPGGRAALYLELRRNGQVTDPRPWLAARS